MIEKEDCSSLLQNSKGGTFMTPLFVAFRRGDKNIPLFGDQKP
jgi:hypothetical protein